MDGDPIAFPGDALAPRHWQAIDNGGGQVDFPNGSQAFDDGQQFRGTGLSDRLTNPGEPALALVRFRHEPCVEHSALVSAQVPVDFGENTPVGTAQDRGGQSLDHTQVRVQDATLT